MPFARNRIKTTTSTGGVGVMTTGAAVIRWRPLSAIPIGSNNVPLLIEDAASADWEISYCTILTANTFNRDTLIDSSTGAFVNFAATAKSVTLVATAADLASFVSGVTITGSTAIGGILSAVLPAGASATGYQWARDGVDISGATSQTYTIVIADQSKRITVRPIGFAPASLGVAIPAPSTSFLAGYGIVLARSGTVVSAPILALAS